MKFTLSWLKDHLDTTADIKTIVNTLTNIGLEVEFVEDKSEKFKDEDRVRRFIRKMINEAAIYESTPGHYNTV